MDCDVFQTGSSRPSTKTIQKVQMTTSIKSIQKRCIFFAFFPCSPLKFSLSSQAPHRKKIPPPRIYPTERPQQSTFSFENGTVGRSALGGGGGAFSGSFARVAFSAKHCQPRWRQIRPGTLFGWHCEACVG